MRFVWVSTTSSTGTRRCSRPATAPAPSRPATATPTAVRTTRSAALNALLGTLRLRNGEPESALPHLEIAHDRKPHDLRIATNLATVLLALDQFDRALEIANRERALADPTLQLARLRGAAAAH